MSIVAEQTADAEADRHVPPARHRSRRSLPGLETSRVIVTFGGDKRKIGDVFYNSMASHPDAAISQWLYKRCPES